jgi:hypothetical protein
MKLAIRIATLTIVVAGVAASSVSSSSSHANPSRQAVSAAMPGPVCTPGIPTCPKSVDTISVNK